MALENKALILDLVEWIARKPRPYFDVMEAWRTSCPRLPNWEEAVAQKLVVRESGGAAGAMVRVTPPCFRMLGAWLHPRRKIRRRIKFGITCKPSIH